MDADVALVAEAGGTERAGPIPRDALRDQRLQALDIQRRHIPHRHEEQLEPDGRRACGESPAGPVDFGAAQKQAGSFPVTAEAGRLPRLPRAARRLLLDRGARDYGTTRVPAHQASERGLIIPRQISDALPGVESDGGDRRTHIGNRPHKSRTMSRLSTPPAAKSPT